MTDQATGSVPFVRADGAHLWDSSGRRYLDYRQGDGSSILGHGHLAVGQAVGQGPRVGTTRELLGVRIAERLPSCTGVLAVAGADRARQLAISAARASTGRTQVLQLVVGGEDERAADPEVTNAPYNVVPAIGPDVAAVVVEPLAIRGGLVPPNSGFLEELRQACTRAGAMLVFDEESSGFRVAAGGMTERTGVVPDLWIFGKVLTATGPIGVVATAGDPAWVSDDDEAVDPSAMAGALAVLDHLDTSSYKMLDGRAEELAKPLRKAMADAGVTAQVTEYGPLLSVTFIEDGSNDEAETRYATFVTAMHHRGIEVPYLSGRPFYPSLAHSWDDVERTADTFAAVADVISRSTNP